MLVSEYLARARACADLVERARPQHKKQIEEIAAAWLKLAEMEAKEVAAKEKR